VVGFITVYSHVQAHRGTFVYDIGLDLLALPYILIVGRLLLQEPTFAIHAHEPWGLVPAVVFCSALILLAGPDWGTWREALRRGAVRAGHRHSDC
jgi:hypothetical protein